MRDDEPALVYLDSHTLPGFEAREFKPSPGELDPRIKRRLGNDTLGAFNHALNSLIPSPGPQPQADANPLIDVTSNNRNSPAAGGSAIPVPVCVMPPVCTVVPAVTPGTPGYAPGNATLAEGSNGEPKATNGSRTQNGPQNLGNNVQLYPDGSLRTPDGKFASVSGNPPPGTNAASQFADFVSSNGVNVVGKEVVVDGPLGPRRYDIVTQDK